MAVLTIPGRKSIAAFLKAKAFHLAWGSGDPSWDWVGDPPTIDPSRTTLIAEVGRHTVQTCEYVTPDDGGAIILPGGNWAVSTPATRWLHFVATTNYGNGAGERIQEIGIFFDTVIAGGVPGGTTYFTPIQVSSPGTLLLLDFNQPIYPNASSRDTFEFVLEI